jgi:Ca-activated chloride channel family protein
MGDTQTTHGFVPVNQATGKALGLSMQTLWLTGQVLRVGARLWVRHEFQSQESTPVEVIYSFVLPRDASLRRFRVSGTDFSVDSELRPTEEAHEIYEAGIKAGSLSTLAREYGDRLVNLSVGNLRPKEKVVVLLEILAGVELHDEGLRLRFPFTLAPSYHAQARSMEVSPGRLELELPAEEFGDLILPQFERDGEQLHRVGFCLDVRVGSGIQEIASPSHGLRVQFSDSHGSQVSLSREGDLPDRDLVLDVRAKTAGPWVMGGLASEGTARFAAVIPSTEFGQVSDGPRRLVILLDRSGSMQGLPLAQAKRAITACLGALDAKDLFGVVAFGNKADLFKGELSESSTENRRAAQEFLDRIESRGGTELASGVEAAANLLQDKQGDILILTDGQVFGTDKILERARAAGMRIHCLGIGSASQDRFLAQLASHTSGVSRFLTPQERVDLSAVELFASIGRPLGKDVRVTVEGTSKLRIVPEPSHFVFSGTPLLVYGEFLPAESARLSVQWLGAEGSMSHLEFPIRLSETPCAGTLRLLQGARIISDFESRHQGAGRRNAVAEREAARVHERLLELSREYGLASSAMSLVAVVKRAGDVPGEIPKTKIVPVGIPSELEHFFGAGLFFGDSSAEFDGLSLSCLRTSQSAVKQDAAARSAAPRLSSLSREFGRSKSAVNGVTAPHETEVDLLVALAGMMEPDGGMPGETEEVRIGNSLGALLYFLREGNTSRSGPFRIHVERLLQYLNSNGLSTLSPANAEAATRVLKGLAAGVSPAGDWHKYAEKLAETKMADLHVFWRELTASVHA